MTALQLTFTKTAVARLGELKNSKNLVSLMSALEEHPFIIFRKRPSRDQTEPAKQSFETMYISPMCQSEILDSQEIDITYLRLHDEGAQQDA